MLRYHRSIAILTHPSTPSSLLIHHSSPSLRTLTVFLPTLTLPPAISSVIFARYRSYAPTQPSSTVTRPDRPTNKKAQIPHQAPNRPAGDSGKIPSDSSYSHAPSCASSNTLTSIGLLRTLLGSTLLKLVSLGARLDRLRSQPASHRPKLG